MTGLQIEVVAQMPLVPAQNVIYIVQQDKTNEKNINIKYNGKIFI